MEDVWKDITLSSLHHHPSSSTSTSSSSASETATSFRGMVLKDFLSTSPFLNDPPPPPTATPAAAFTSPASMFACPSPTIAAPQPHHPATILSLNSTPEFHFLDAGHHTDHLQGNLVPNFSAPFDAFSSSPFLSSFGKRSGDLEAGSGDRRHKRMIKNRESAARSRARKQEINLSPSLPAMVLFWKIGAITSDRFGTKEFKGSGSVDGREYQVEEAAATAASYSRTTNAASASTKEEAAAAAAAETSKNINSSILRKPI